MEWQIVVALLVAVPIILFPVALVWFLNIGGVYAAVKEALARRATQRKATRELVKVTREE